MDSKYPSVARGGSWLIEPVGSRPVFILADFGPEEHQYAEIAERFVQNDVMSRLTEIEAQKEGVMPALLKKAGELGLLMIDVPEAYGGLGLSWAASMLVSERAAKCASFSVSWGAHTGIGTLPLVYYGTEDQKRRYLPKLATGEWLAAYALTEPQSGSDALGAKTTAVPSADGRFYVVNGVKQFITNAGFADLFTVFVRVVDTPGSDGKFSALLIERSASGVSTGPEEHKLGIKGSSTRQLLLDDVKVPVENLLGEVGRGHKIAFNILNVGRFKLGCGSVGAAKECLQVAVRYAKERRQFGKPIAEFGMVQRKIADMAVRIYVADAMGYRTAGLLDAATDAIDASAADYYRRAVDVIDEFTMEASIIKIFGTECLDFASDESLQILGGYGFTADYPIERHFRDARINRIFEGTNEINRLVIPATLMKRVGQGALPLMEFLERVKAEIGEEAKRAVPAGEPLAIEVHATEMAKRIVAYTAEVMIQKELANLRSRQQHLELFANMVIDVYAMDSAVARTLKLLRSRGADATAMERDLTHVFVASANERAADAARRLLANECEGEELRGHLAVVDGFQPFFPIRTIDMKTRIAKEVVDAGGEVTP
jgi:alkylation response protein AidB-like acyl-CoA dehydrogenase